MSADDDVIAGGVVLQRNSWNITGEQVQIVELETLGAWWATSIVLRLIKYSNENAISSLRYFHNHQQNGEYSFSLETGTAISIGLSGLYRI